MIFILDLGSSLALSILIGPDEGPEGDAVVGLIAESGAGGRAGIVGPWGAGGGRVGAEPWDAEG